MFPIADFTLCYAGDHLKLETYMRRTLALTALALSLLATAACNTVQGVGRDIESVGKTGREVIN
jgi:predicted small secreted protein